MKRIIFCAALIVAGGLVANAAMADECKPINVRIGPSDYLGPCSYDDTDFQFCIDTPIKGTLNGTWHYYGEAGNGTPIEPGPPYSSFSAGYALGVIDTNKGEIMIQDNWMWNWNTFTDDRFPFVTLANITGGTGHYEGALGWLGVIGDDSGNWRGFMRGQMCTP